MADPFSVTAGVVSLADVVWRTSKELYAFFAAVNDASKDVQSMLLELQHFDGILTSIKNNADSFNSSACATDDGLSASGLLANLRYCLGEFEVLKDMVEESKRNQGQGSVKKLASKIKWVFDEKKIVRSCKRLGNVKVLLTTVLSLAGREDSGVVRPYDMTRANFLAGKMISSSAASSSLHRMAYRLRGPCQETNTKVSSFRCENLPPRPTKGYQPASLR